MRHRPTSQRSSADKFALASAAAGSYHPSAYGRHFLQMTAILALEDGRTFHGEAFGHSGTSTGEICFTTGMTGYQETLTDPSFAGQIVTMTYTMIGNTGIVPEDMESYKSHVRGFVVEEVSPVISNWRARQSLPDFLAEQKVIGIEGIDTRALTKHIRSAGAMRACLTTELSEADAIEAARNSPSMVGADFVKEVTIDKQREWSDESREWVLVSPSQGQATNYADLPEARYDIVAFDFGIKFNILRRLRQAGFNVTVVPADTSAEDVLALKPDGVFLSNGPGDPSALDYIHTELAKLIESDTPIFGICLGNQLIAHALGAKTIKLKFGHRGGNQPVKDLRDGKVAITSQNHGFAVDGDTLPDHVEVTHINLNDNTVEGIRHKTKPVFSVQYHPEAAPGPNDASYFFQEFADLIEASKS